MHPDWNEGSMLGFPVSLNLVPLGKGNYDSEGVRIFWEKQNLLFFFFWIQAIPRPGKIPNMFSVLGLVFAEHVVH